MEFRTGIYDLPFGRVEVAVNPSGFEWRNRRIVALTPVQEVAIRGLANRYRRTGIGAPLAATTQPTVSETGIQVAPRMKLPMMAVLRLDAPRRQLAMRDLRATLDLYNTYDVPATTISGKTVPLEADNTAVLAYVLASLEIWERELKTRAGCWRRRWSSTMATGCGTRSPISRSIGSMCRPKHAICCAGRSSSSRCRTCVGRLYCHTAPRQLSDRISADRAPWAILTLPIRGVQTAADLGGTAATSKIDPGKLRSGSLFGMTPNNPVIQTIADTPIAPGVHAHSIIAAAGNGPVEGSGDGVVKYSSSHLDGADSEYIVRSGHSVQSNPYAIEEVRRILLLHAADVCARIPCGKPPAPPPTGLQASSH